MLVSSLLWFRCLIFIPCFICLGQYNLGQFGGGTGDPHSTGNFGPFQVCFGYIITHCGGAPGGFHTTGK